MNQSRIASAQRTERRLDEMSAATLTDLERQLTGALYALWRAQGVEKRIVRVDGERAAEMVYNGDGGGYEQRSNNG